MKGDLKPGSFPPVFTCSASKYDELGLNVKSKNNPIAFLCFVALYTHLSGAGSIVW